MAIFEVLPNLYPERLSRETTTLVSSLTPRIGDFLGTSLSQLAICFLSLMNWQGIAYIHSKHALEFRISNSYAVRDDRDRRVMILTDLFERDHLLDPFLTFTARRLAQALVHQQARAAFGQQLQKFMRIFSATTEELRRNALEGPEFQLGSISNRLSPLERYPIVQMGGADYLNEFVIPNAAYFLKSFSAIIDYSLLTEFGNSYSQLRGALLELYVRCLIEDRLPHLTIIPEVAYGREERRGPDLTLIDRELGRIILVEVKGRRIRLSTRLKMTEEELRENLGDAHEALRKLPRKLEELYSGLPEYREYQDAIESTRGATPVFVAILSEGVYSMGELVREMGTHPGDPLYDYPFPYCVVSLDVFERAVETARRRSEPLVTLLHTHWERSLRREYHNAGADSFDGSHIPESETFAGSFAPW